jgi:prolyl oligopeptidase
VAFLAWSALAGIAATQEPAALAPSPVREAAMMTERYAAFERADDPAVRAWVEAERDALPRELASTPERAWFRKRFAELSAQTSFTLPERQGRYYVTSRTREDGSSEFTLSRAFAASRPLLTLTDNADGMMCSLQASPDGRRVAYARASASVATMQTWRIRDLAIGRDEPGTVITARAGTALIWSADSAQVFFIRAGEHAGEPDALVRRDVASATRTSASGAKEMILFADADSPRLMLAHEDGDATIVVLGNRAIRPVGVTGASSPGGETIAAASAGAAAVRYERVWSFDSTMREPTLRVVVDAPGARLAFVARDGRRFLFLTDHRAPRGRVIAVTPGKGWGEREAAGSRTASATDDLNHIAGLQPNAEANWQTLIASAEPDETLEQLVRVGQRYAARWWVPGRRIVRLYDATGRFEGEALLPGTGTVSALSAGSPRDLFVLFSSYTTPASAYRYDTTRRTLHLLRAADVPFDSAAYETIPLAIRTTPAIDAPQGVAETRQTMLIGRRGLARRADAPLLVYFNGFRGLSATPGFAFTVAGWLDAGGRLAVMNLDVADPIIDQGNDRVANRIAGRSSSPDREHDVEDVASLLAALVRDGYAHPSRLAVHGGGPHGSVLVADTLLRHPELAAAFWTSTGPMDLLAIDRPADAPPSAPASSAAPRWANQYGDTATAEGRERRRRLSPLEAIATAAAAARGRWPAHLLTISDPGVPAWHTYKFVAAMNDASGGRRVAWLRETPFVASGSRSGPAAQPALLDERADVYAFFATRLGLQIDLATVPPSASAARLERPEPD